MAGAVLRFERDYDLAPGVVWDALVDSDLVGGWLAEAHIDPRIGGRYDLTWHAPIGLGSTNGEIAELIEPELLVVELERIGTVTFTLGELPQGTNGLATRLMVTVDSVVEILLSDGLSATWLASLDQLEMLLRGRPVDWSRWQLEHGDSWSEHLERLRQR